MRRAILMKTTNTLLHYRRRIAMNIGLIVIGDEILSGKRTNKHMSKIIELLGACDL
jgi:hypothetical protein